LILKNLRIVKSNIEDPLAREVTLPAKMMLELIKAIEAIRKGLLFLNLAEFQHIQILLKIETTTAMITSWHWGLQPLLAMFTTSAIELRLMFTLITEENQFQGERAKGH
jgi:hypothetical protein